MSRIIVSAWLLLAGAAAGQGVDREIQKDLERVLELGASPSEATEEQRKAAAEAFKGALVRLVESWGPRAKELDAGRYALGRGFLLAGKPAEAVPHLEGFVRDHPTSEDVEDATLALGSALLEARLHERAAEVYSGFLASRPSSSQRIVARYYLAIARLEGGRTEEGIRGLAEVAATDGEHPLVADANLQLVTALADAGRTQEARTRLDALLAKHADARALLSLKDRLDWIGKAAPEIEGVRTWLNGPGTTLAALRGGVTVVVFFAEPYESSRLELGKLRDLAAALGNRPVAFVGLTTYYRRKLRPEDEEDKLLAAFLEQERVRFPVGVVTDFGMLRKYAVKGVPHTVVVGTDGTVRHLKIGAGPSDVRGEAALRAAILRAVPEGR